MNGDFRELYIALAQKLGELQGSYEANWRNHTERALEVIKKIDKIDTKLDNLPCGRRAWIGRAVIGIYALLGSAGLAVLIAFLM